MLASYIAATYVYHAQMRCNLKGFTGLRIWNKTLATIEHFSQQQSLQKRLHTCLCMHTHIICWVRRYLTHFRPLHMKVCKQTPHAQMGLHKAANIGINCIYWHVSHISNWYAQVFIFLFIASCAFINRIT